MATADQSSSPNYSLNSCSDDPVAAFYINKSKPTAAGGENITDNDKHIFLIVYKKITHKPEVFLKNYIYIILLFYREHIKSIKYLQNIRCNI